jgi:hypothetical protein
MIAALLLAVLAVFDGVLAGFRAAAGRDGRIDKRGYIRVALARGAWWGAIVVAANAGLAAALVATSQDRGATWHELVRAGTTCAWVFGSFATATLAAIALWFSPVHEHRLLSLMIVLGPLTLVRPIVIVVGLALGAATTTEPRVWIVAATAALTMLGLERVLGRRHVDSWRALV